MSSDPSILTVPSSNTHNSLLARFALSQCPHVRPETRRLAETWPEQWKPEVLLVIDALAISTEQLTDRLTDVMSSAFETVPELGGRKAEVQVVK